MMYTFTFFRDVNNKMTTSQYFFYIWLIGQTNNFCKFNDTMMSQENFDLI